MCSRHKLTAINFVGAEVLHVHEVLNYDGQYLEIWYAILVTRKGSECVASIPELRIAD